MRFERRMIQRALPVLLAALMLMIQFPCQRAGAELSAPLNASGPAASASDSLITTLFLNSHEPETAEPGKTSAYRFTPSADDTYVFMSFPAAGESVPETEVRLIRESDGSEIAASRQTGCFRVSAELIAEETYLLEITCLTAGSMAVEVMLDSRGRSFENPIALPDESVRYAKTIVRPRDVHWFSFTAPVSGWYSIRTESTGSRSPDTQGRLFDSDGCEIAFNDDILFPGDANFMIQHELTAGETCFVRISAFSNETGAYRLVLTLPEEGQTLPEAITLSRHDLLLDVDQEFRLSADVRPANALPEVVYASSDSRIISVEPDGTVRALAAGEATVRAISYNGIQDSCRVTVRPVEVTHMAFEEDEVSLHADEQLTLSPVFLPENASDRTAKYTSSDESVVTVSPYGVLTGVSEGDAVVTAVSSDGSFTDTVLVHVGGVRPVYRALVLGEQTYEDGVRMGGLNTVQGVADMLANQSIEGEAYQVQLQLDSTLDEMSAGVREAFAGAKETDISLLYINCHGAYEDGAAFLRLHDETRVTPEQLEALLRDIPGQMIVILDFCQSGAFLGADEEFERFSEDAQAAFAGGTPLTSGRYTVITSASASEDSYRRSFTNARDEAGTASLMGRSLCEGAGWDLIYDRSVTLKADADRDRLVTVQEICEYAKKRVMHYLDGSGVTQTVHFYPADDQTVLFGRN